MFLLRKLRFFSHSKCKESQSVSDLSSLESLHDDGVSNPAYNLKRSKSAEQLNNDVIHSMQTTTNNASFMSTASNSTTGSTDDYLHPCAETKDISKSVKKIAIVNPTTHIFPEDDNEVFEESHYQNVEISKTQGKTAESDDGKEGSIYQNVEPLSYKVEEKDNHESEYQNIVFPNVSTDCKSESFKGDVSECDYEFVQGLAATNKTVKSEQKNDDIDGRSGDEKLFEDNVKLRKESNACDKASDLQSAYTCDKASNLQSAYTCDKGSNLRSASVSVPNDVSNSVNKSSTKPPKKPKPERPPPPKFSSNLTPFKNRYTSPDLLTESRVHKPPEKSVSIDNGAYMNDPGKTRENRGKLLFRNARSASEQIVRRSENINDYLDMSNSRPGEVVLDDSDDYMPMSLEDNCPLKDR